MCLSLKIWKPFLIHSRIYSQLTHFPREASVFETEQKKIFNPHSISKSEIKKKKLINDNSTGYVR